MKSLKQETMMEEAIASTELADKDANNQTKMTNEKPWWEEIFWETKASRDINGKPNQSDTNNFIMLSFISKVDQRAREEEHKFFTNILDGIDVADKQMNNSGGGTKAIMLLLRFALKSRYIKSIK